MIIGRYGRCENARVLQHINLLNCMVAMRLNKHMLATTTKMGVWGECPQNWVYGAGKVRARDCQNVQFSLCFTQ
jgi:hypothetical protein